MKLYQIDWKQKISTAGFFSLLSLFWAGALHAQEQGVRSADQFPSPTMIVAGVVFLIGVSLAVFLLFAGVLKRFRSFSRDAALIQSWNIARERLRFFVGILLLQRVVSTIPFLVTLVAFIILRQSYYAYTVDLFGVTFTAFDGFARILDILLGAFFVIGLIRIAFNLLDKKEVRIHQLFSGLILLPRFLLAGAIYAFCVLVGFIVFIIPGIYLAVALSFWPQYIIDTNAGPLEALKRSWRATRGARGELFLFYTLIFFINIGGLLTFLVGTFLTIPMTLVALAHVYRQLSQKIVSSQTA